MLHHQKKAKVLKEVPGNSLGMWASNSRELVFVLWKCSNIDYIYIYRGSCQNPGGVLLASWCPIALQVKPWILGIKTHSCVKVTKKRLVPWRKCLRTLARKISSSFTLLSYHARAFRFFHGSCVIITVISWWNITEYKFCGLNRKLNDRHGTRTWHKPQKKVFPRWEEKSHILESCQPMQDFCTSCQST